MKPRAFLLLLFMFCLVCLAAAPRTHSAVPGEVVAKQVEFRGGEIRGVLENNASYRVRDVELLIRYFWVWKGRAPAGGRAPELSFNYTVRQEIPPRGRIPFSYKTPPLPARNDGYYDIEVTVARSVNVDALAAQAAGAGVPEHTGLKMGRDVARIVEVEGLVVNGPLVAGVLRNKAPHAIRDVELLIRHVWVPSNEYRPGGDDPGRAAYYTVLGEIQPGETASFAYDALPLPARKDGEFQTKVAVAGFVEVGLGRAAQDRDAPTVRVGKLALTPELGRDTARLEAVVEDPSGLEAVEVWLNGRKATNGELAIDARNRDRIQISRTFSLPRFGDNCVAVAARDVNGNSSMSEEVCLYREPASRAQAVREARGPAARPRAGTPAAASEASGAGTPLTQDTEGPRIELLQPGRAGTVALGTVLVEAAVDDASGIDAVEVWLNDEKVPSLGAAEIRGLRRATIEQSVQVKRMGINCFALNARDLKGNTSKERVCLVTRRQAAPGRAAAPVRSAPRARMEAAPGGTAPPAVASATPPRRESPAAPASAVPEVETRTALAAERVAGAGGNNRYAVVIGVGDYADARIPDLRYADADARAVYALLTDPSRGGFRPGNVKLILGRSADRRSIMTAVGDWLLRKVQKGDEVLLYYAGYGAVEKDRAGRERDGFAKYLVPSDAIRDNLFVSGISNDELARLLAGLGTGRLVVFLDASYASAAKGRGRGLAPDGVRRGALSNDVYDRLSGPGRAVVGAAKPNQAAVESSKLGHGLFTKYLLDGLGGGADTNRDGRVTLAEVYPYLAARVPAAARAEAGGQDPVLRGSVAEDLILASVPQSAERISMERKIEILKQHYLARRITAKQFDRAVRTLESGKQDRMLEDFVNGEISVSTFRRSF